MTQDDLFQHQHDPRRNLLPEDGSVHYFGVILLPSDANSYLIHLLSNIDWQHDEVNRVEKNNFTKRIVTKRKVAWYGDKPFTYTYSNTTKIALPWTEDLIDLKKIIEQTCGETFNSCLLNLYHDGSEGMSWHSDAEKDLKRNGAIASLSLGAERKFSFKHKQNRKSVHCLLEHGSLLVMKGLTQTHWLHALPTTTKVTQPRINLTFRTIID